MIGKYLYRLFLALYGLFDYLSDWAYEMCCRFDPDFYYDGKKSR